MLYTVYADLVMWERMRENEGGKRGRERKEWEREKKTINHRVPFTEKKTNLHWLANTNEKNERKTGKNDLVDSHTHTCLCKLSLFKKCACFKCWICLVTSFYSNLITFSPLSWHGWKVFAVSGEVVTHSFAVLFINSFLQKHFLSCWEGRRV